MAKYTGRRIVPKHAGEWDIRKEYEELQIVLDADSGNSFISNLPVPKGTALSDEKYWSLFSLHSEQIAEAEEHLTQTAEDIRSELSETENRINKNVSDTEGRINESLSSTESKVNTSLSETENRVTARVENAKSDLTAKVAEAEQQMNQNAQNVAQTNKALNARMDQIAKGRTSDTEVLDARVDSEGNTFDNLGAAIRSIYPKAKEGLDALQESKVDANYDATGELTEGITVNTINGETQKFEHVQTTALIPVDTACQKVYYTGQVFNWIGVAGYDANGTFVASILDSRDTEQPQEYKEKELEIPEGVFQIRASSYAKDLSLKVCGESAKLWNQVQRERQNQKKMAVEIEALRSADDALAKETMTSLDLPFLYDGVSNIWEGSSPVLQTYYVPLTVLQSVFVQEIQFTLRTIGETTLTAMLESEDGEVFRQSVELVKGDNRITLILHRFIDEGAYKLRVRSTDKVLYYPVRPNTGKEIRNDFFSNEPSGNVEYDYKNRLIVFMGKILIGTGKVDTTLSYSGMAADAAVVGQAFKDEREYTDTLASGKLDAVHSRNLLDPSRYRPGWFAFVHSSIIQYHADNLRYGSTDYIPVSEKGLVTKGSGTNGVTSQVVFDKAKKVLRYVDANDQYTYQEGDAYVMFFYMASSGQKLCVVEGTEYVYEAYCGSVLCQKTYTDHRNGHKQKVNKGEKPKYLIRNHHPAIISEELWQEAQEVWKAYTAKYRGIEKGRNERNYSKLLLCGECGRYFQGHSTTRTTIWRCATKLAQQGQKRCRMEPIYEEQIQTLLCKAFAEKFKLGEKMDAEVHEVMQMISKAPIDNARNQALKNLTEKLREIHDFDQMEQEGDFLKRQLSAVNYSIRDVHQHIRDIQAEKEALKVRCEVLGEPRDKEAVTELENRLLNEEEQLEKLEHEAQQQAEQVRYMEDYWKKLEQTHEIREKTLQWLDSLAGGTQMFLDEAVGTYVKAFVLSVTIFSPKHFRIHWFDDTCTEVECDSVFEGYQQPGMIRRKY